VSCDSNVEPFVRSLDQELLALMRGASLECPVCGEFVMHAREGVVFCPECRSIVGTQEAIGSAEDNVASAVDGLLGTALEFGLQAG
jgi:hypothetical protein